MKYGTRRPNCVSRLLLVLFAFFRRDISTFLGGQLVQWWSFCTLNGRFCPPTPTVCQFVPWFLDLEIQKFCLEKCGLCRILREVSGIIVSVQFDCLCLWWNQKDVQLSTGSVLLSCSEVWSKISKAYNNLMHWTVVVKMT